MKDTDQAIQVAEELLKPWTLSAHHPEPGRLDVMINSHDLKSSVNALMQAGWGYLAAITGMDHKGSPVPPSNEHQWDRLSEEPEQETPKSEGTIEVLYHFCEGAAVTTLRTFVPYSKPVLSTVCDLIPSATLYERELMEMFGVTLEGTPDDQRLLLPDDWPSGVYPLRKSFTGFSESEQ
jgi:NADH:ubiquinone oxidoreductase subunit C